MKQILLLSSAISFLLCAASKQAIAKMSKTETHYYYGEVRTTSPDGKIPYGPVKFSLVKRTIDRGNRTITELVKQGGKIFDTKLSQSENPTIFKAEDTNTKSFSGTVSFMGKDWNWNKWTYDINMTDGSGKIIGEGKLTNNSIKTTKKFVSPDGTEQVLISENLKEITEQDYLKLNK